jgi:membrane-bound metal-dependent hydrolase YbcI (DUF457 family)
MPLTPFHLGPALFFGLLLFRYLNFPAFLVANVIVDIEPFFVLFLGLQYPLHGFFHSFLGGTVLGVVTAVGIYLLRDWSNKILAMFKVQQKSSFTQIFYTSVLGVHLHIFLDSFLYSEMNPFYPLAGNPLLNVVGFSAVYEFCAVSFIFGLILYVYKLMTSKEV